MTARPTPSAATARAVVNRDGTGTWSIGGGLAESITATTAAAVPYAMLYRTVAAAAQQGTAVELTVTLDGVPILLEVSPTGEITRFEIAPATGTSRGKRAVPSRWAIVAAAGALAAAVLAGLVLVRDAGGGSASPSTVPSTGAAPSRAAVSPFTSEVAPAVAGRELHVTVKAPQGGPLTARVRATAAPTVVRLTIWREGMMVARRRLHLTVARATWSSAAVTFNHTGPGGYRWAATAPGAARVTGTYTVPVKPASRDRRAHRSTRPGAVGVTPPPTRVPASSTPVALPPAIPRPSTPEAPTGTQRPEPHNGPVPGGNTNPPHPGPSP